MRKLMLVLLTGVLFAGCKKEDEKSTPLPIDPCEGVVCLNGGECIDGDCDCPKQWSGPDCSIQVTPDAILIKDVTISKFPATNNGASWDPNSGADLKFYILQGSNLLYFSSYVLDADPNSSHFWAIDEYIFDPSGLIMEFWDDDGFSASGNLMYRGGFSLYNSTNSFPTSLTFSNTEVEFTLGLEYIHN